MDLVLQRESPTGRSVPPGCCIWLGKVGNSYAYRWGGRGQDGILDRRRIEEPRQGIGQYVKPAGTCHGIATDFSARRS